MEPLIPFLFLWFVFSFAVGAHAPSKDRNQFAWFFLALLFSPFIAGIFLLAMEHGGPQCPRCQEHIRTGATICHWCQQHFSKAAA